MQKCYELCDALIALLHNMNIDELLAIPDIDNVVRHWLKCVTEAAAERR